MRWYKKGVKRLAPSIVAIASLACHVLAGCAEKGALVEVSMAEAMDDQLDAFCLSISARDEVQFSRRYPLDEVQLPATLAVVTKSDSLDRATAVVTGHRAGQVIGRVRASLDLDADDPETERLTLEPCQRMVTTSRFVSRTVGTTTSAITMASRADVDGDGVDEVLVLPGRGPLTFLDSSGATTELGWTADRTGGGDMATADLNRDCAPDHLIADQGGLIGAFSRAFEDISAATGSDVPPLVCTTVALGDLDGDGQLDAVVGIDTEDVRGVMALTGDDRGGFGAGDDPVLLTLGWSPTDLAADDLDGDGLDDIAVVGDAGTRALLRGDSDRLLVEVLDAFPVDERDLGVVATGDLDRDGRPEVVVGGEGFEIWRRRSSGAYEAVDLAGLDELTSSVIVGLAIGDADGDCALDLMVMVEDAPSWLLSSDGAGGLEATWEGNLPSAVAGAIGEFTGDGRPDLYLHQRGSGSSGEHLIFEGQE